MIRKSVFPGMGVAVISFAVQAANAAPGDAAGLGAESWSYSSSARESAKRSFEVWRGAAHSKPLQRIDLPSLTVPARNESSMVRIRGVLTPPATGNYAFLIDGTRENKFAAPDEAEMWILDPANGAWRLVQRTGNPNKRTGRIALTAGVSVAFEFYTMGSREVSVSWCSQEWNAAHENMVVAVPLAVVPASAMSARLVLPDDGDGDGLKDSFKQKWELDPTSGDGANGPWGDPDADGLTNWQEQQARTNPLVSDTAGREGLVRWELWREIPGQYVFDLKRSANFPSHPTEVRYLTSLEIPVGNGDSYGSRLRGWIKAPVSGEYTLQIIADDQAELWVGDDEAWQSKKLIARASGNPQARWVRNTPDGEAPLRDGQTAKLTLEAGRKYYVEVLQKQDNSLDHCAVAWIRPDKKAPEVIGGRNLVAWEPVESDRDDDGLADAWQQSTGLSSADLEEVQRTATGDPDGDGLTNWEEMKAGTDPLKRELPGSIAMLSSQSWSGVPGTRVKDLAEDVRYPADPDFTTLVDNMDFSNEGADYGARLRGFLTAPDEGAYRFHISGNNSCTLYLGESEDKFTKRVIAKVDLGTRWRQFSGNPLQESDDIELQKGKRYYVEILYKRGEADEEKPRSKDHSSVAWTRPGMKRTVIEREFFSPYQPDPRDVDDDDLPDEWERVHGLDPADPSGINGPWGDADGDWLENLREYQFGLHPRKGDVDGVPGLSLQETWEDVQGKMPGLKGDPRYPLSPTRRQWLESLEIPQGGSIHYGNRLRALLVPPVTGQYVFSIASFNGGELLLSSSDAKYGRKVIATVETGNNFRQWDKTYDDRMSAPVYLEKGKHYFIEAIHQNHALKRASHLSIGWRIPGSTEFELIEGSSLVAFAGDPNDVDDDDLPDAWELANGLKTGDRDTDGDTDHDGLTNLEEFLAGTRPNVTDTDNDGVDDRMELEVTGTDPLKADVSPFVLVETKQASDYVGIEGPWRRDGTGLLNAGGRGWVDYRLSIPADGIYMVQLHTQQWNEIAGPASCELVFSIDGVSVQRKTIRNEGAPGALVSVVTPWLAEGSHVIRVFLDNAYHYRRVVYDELSIYSAAGSDGDGNGVPDWVQLRLSERNSLDTGMTASRISPACLEGRTGWVAFASGADLTTAPNARWFANVPLAEDGSATPVSLSFENGGLVENVEVVWLATNLMTDRMLTVRQGDSLRLTATSAADGSGLATESVSIAVDGQTLQFNAAEPQAHRFDKPGKTILKITHLEDGVTSSFDAVVNVIAPLELGSPVFVPGFERSWTNPGLGSDITMQWDSQVKVSALPLVDPVTGIERRWFTASSPFDLSILCRLENGGPVLASVPMRRLTLQDGDETGTRIVENIDGIYRVEMPVVLSDVFADVTAHYRIVAGGVTYGDGSGPELDLLSADFNPLGEIMVEFLKPAASLGSVCHRASLWQGSERVAQFP